MIHSFDVEVAKDHGIEAAVILQNMNFWIEKNRANEKHFYDGRYWMYNSIRAFCELFPYMSQSTIRRTLEKLQEDGIIATGNYNKAGYDRTLWYAITEKGYSILNKSICQIEQINSPKTPNPFAQNGKPIPDSVTDKKPIEEVPALFEPIHEMNPIYYELAKLLVTLHQRNIDSGFAVTEERLKSWRKPISDIERLDGRTTDEIRSVIEWVKTPGNFWGPNIMSGKKLREQFPRLVADMKTKGIRAPVKVRERTTQLEMDEL